MRGGGLALQRYLAVLPDKKSPQLKRLSPEHKNMIILHLEGMPAHQIAEELGRSPGHVSSVLRSDLAQALINDYLSFADLEFQALYKLSIDAIRDALQDSDINVRLKAADRYLKTHGKDEGGKGKDSAEDVITRIMSMILDKKEKEEMRDTLPLPPLQIVEKEK